MNDVEIGWVAGLLEGEGSFITPPNKFSPKITVEMTDKDVIEKLQGLLGGKVYPIKARRENWKPTFVFVLTGPDAADIMNLILPLMSERRSKKIVDILSNWKLHGNFHKGSKGPKAISAAKVYAEGGRSLRGLAQEYGVNKDAIRRAYLDLTGPVT